ncbi:MAG: phosphate/phosphite/phosphonate ABC transporter substrate-binding protein [Eubacteriales bacterium]
MRKFKFMLMTLLLVFVIAGCSNTKEESTESLLDQTTDEPTESSLDKTTEESNTKTAENQEHKDWPKTLRFADTGVEGFEQLQREFGPFKDALEDTLGVKIEFFAVTDRTAAAVAAEFDQVDFVLTGPSEYVVMKSKVDVQPVVGITRPGYRSAFMAKSDSGIKSLEDLKGKKIGMKDIGSTSGHIGPSSILIENGFNLDKDFDGQIGMLGDARLETLRNGDVDAIGSGIKDYKKLVEQDGKESWTLVHEGPDLPNDLFVASPNLPKDFVAEVKSLMVKNQEKIIESIVQTGENQKYEESELVDAKDSDYDSIRKAYETLGMKLE